MSINGRTFPKLKKSVKSLDVMILPVSFLESECPVILMGIHHFEL
jgi:hypothetical protein